MSSEWSQRTALITFTLVPKRMRVMSAKIAASLVLGAIVLVIALVVAVVAIAAVGGEWTMGLGVFGQIALLCVTAILTGVAFGAAFLSSAPAIVLYFALPIAWAALGSIPFLNDAAQWLDTTRTTEPMTERLLSGEEWAAVRDLAGCCGWRCPWRSACGGSPRARSAPPSSGVLSRRRCSSTRYARESSSSGSVSVTARAAMASARSPERSARSATRSRMVAAVSWAQRQSRSTPSLRPSKISPLGGVDDERRVRMGEQEPVAGPDDVDR